jgi:hypothetical protein
MEGERDFSYSRLARKDNGNDQWSTDLSQDDIESLSKKLNDFILDQNMLYFKNGLRNRLFVPQAERITILRRYHESLGHLASKSIIIERYYWWSYIAYCSY